MSKYSHYRTESAPKPSRLPVHPVWRGIGCVISIVVPLLAFILASQVINSKENYPWLIIPTEIVFPVLKDEYLLVKILYAGLSTFIILAILGLITFALNRFFGPSRYEPQDVPLDKVNKTRH